MTCLALRHYFARFSRTCGPALKCVPIYLFSLLISLSTERDDGVVALPRTVHGPAIERDAAGRRESRRHGGLTTDSIAIGF
jgi:hypothetical protein